MKHLHPDNYQLKYLAQILYTTYHRKSAPANNQLVVWTDDARLPFTAPIFVTSFRPIHIIYFTTLTAEQ